MNNTIRNELTFDVSQIFIAFKPKNTVQWLTLIASLFTGDLVLLCVGCLCASRYVREA